MPLTPLTTSPAETDYTPLSAHQEQTPNTFFASKPVLHYHSPNATLKVETPEFQAREELRALSTPATDPSPDEENLVSVTDVDIWVGSRDLRLFSPTQSAGLLIPYPSITVHAQLGPAILLELNLSDPNLVPENELEHLQLRLLPSPSTTNSTTATSDLYAAIGACQELNPDPMDRDSDEEAAAFDETAPGATGWITSENMGEFVDGEGNFRVPGGVEVIGGEEEGGLGQGAGRVRRAEEVDAGAEVDGDGEGEGEGKWRRTG